MVIRITGLKYFVRTEHYFFLITQDVVNPQSRDSAGKCGTQSATAG